jgi:hypothetical protein
MKKLIILSFLSVGFTSNAVGMPNEGKESTTVRAIRATKDAYKKTKTYIKDSASEFGAEVKDIAQEVGDQFKEVGHDIYDATLAPAFTATKKVVTRATNKAKQAGTRIKAATRDTYSKTANSKFVTTTKNMGSEIKEQLTEITQTTYHNAVKTPAIAVSEKAAAIATAIKEKIVAAKNATKQAAIDAKNSDFADDMKDVGAQFKEVATDATYYVTKKSTHIWDQTKVTVLEIQEELAN